MSVPSEPSPTETLQSNYVLTSFSEQDGLIIILLVILLAIVFFLTGVQLVFRSVYKLKHPHTTHLQRNSFQSFSKNKHKPSKKVFFTLITLKNIMVVAFVVLSNYLLTKYFLTIGLSISLTICISIVLISICLIVVRDFFTQHWVKKHKDLSLTIGSFIIYFLERFTFSMRKKDKLSDNIKNNTSIDETISVDWKNDEVSFIDQISLSGNQTLLKSLLNFSNTETRHVMCPRMEVVGVDKKNTLNELLHIVTQTGYSRLPVYDDNYDNVVGVIYAKDLLPYLSKSEEFSWQKTIRKPLFVPENKKIDDLLKSFQSKKTHFAIVVDEYGGTSGIITLEDILEEIVGDITDEYDEEAELYKQINSNIYSFDARIELEEFCNIMNIDLSLFNDFDNDSETLGGFISQLMGQIPEPQQIIELDFLKFIVEEADKKRIKRLRVMKK